MTNNHTVPGAERKLPRECQSTGCTQLTQALIIGGCLEAHVEDKCLCTQHAVKVINGICDEIVYCLHHHKIIAYQTRDIHWDANDFPGQWVLLADEDYRVLAVNNLPEPLVAKMKTTNQPTTIMKVQ